MTHTSNRTRTRPQAASDRVASARARKKRAGFTLVEMMVTIVIIGLLATVVVINVLPSQDKAMVGKARADLATLENALEQYRLDMLTFPTTGEGLSALTAVPSGSPRADRYRTPAGRPVGQCLSVPPRKRARSDLRRLLIRCRRQAGRRGQ